jgi:hypothetical protein
MKKEISWKGLVKKTAENHKKSGTFDFKTVLADAGKEWKDIKSGKHSEYVQGTSSPSTRKNKKSSSKKTKSNKVSSHKVSSHKVSSHKVSSHSDCDAEMILSKNILCKTCKGKVQKLMKKQGGGGDLSPSEYKSSGGKNSELSPSEYNAAPEAAKQKHDDVVKHDTK